MGRPLVFALNGERVELADVDPRTTVLQHIRSHPNLQGTKLGCGEGGCGACTVLLSRYDPTSKRVEELTINSCLALLCSVDGWAITTTEGLKTPKNGVHAIHKRMAGFHASQCGFCSPGMSMSIYGGLRKATSKAGTPMASGECSGPSVGTCSGSSAESVPMTALDAANSISGNICRCTGYRPILDVCRSFSRDVDVEDLGLNSFWASKDKADAALLPSYNSKDDPKFPSFLIEELESRKGSSPAKGLSFKQKEGRETTVQRQWITASSLADAFGLLKLYSTVNLEVQLVAGNTGAGVYKGRHPEVYMDIGRIPELQIVRATAEGLEVGAGIPLSKLIGLLEAKPNYETVVFKELAKHVKQIASEQVRNRASLGGNLILAQKFGFDSDLATILVGAGAEVTVASANGSSTMPILEFLSQGGLESGRILISVHIPSWNDLLTATGPSYAKLFFKTYRISCRPKGNAVAYINAAFLAVVDEKSLEIRRLKLAFGAFGGPHAVRAVKTEKLLVGKSVTPALLLEAIKTLKAEINPSPTVYKSAYRRSVAVAFFFDFFKSFLPSSTSELAPPATLGEQEEEEEDKEDGTVLDAHKTTEQSSVTAGDSSSQFPEIDENGLALSNGTASDGRALSNGSAPSIGKALSSGSTSSDGRALSNCSAPSNERASSNDSTASNGEASSNGHASSIGGNLSKGSTASDGEALSNGSAASNGGALSNGGAVLNGGALSNGSAASNGGVSSNGSALSNGSAASNGEALSNGNAVSHAEASRNGSAATNGGPLSNGCAISNGKDSINVSAPENDLQVVEFGTKTKSKVVKGKKQTSTPGSSQKFVTSKEFWPVAKPSKKNGAHLQASGEAVYVDDVTPLKGTLYAAFVLSDKRPGKIVSIDTSEALKSPGAVDFVSAKDIPGRNLGFDFFFHEDRLFADEKVECIHDIIGVLVADSYENARDAASKVRLDVEEEDGCIYTIEEAIAKESFQDPGMFAPMAVASVGETLVTGDHRIENGEVYCGSQYHFCMETLTAYAIPDEDESVTVYSANQNPASVQKALALSLGIPMNSVRVITRRLGGAFGGKSTRASLVAVASAVAAFKLKRPVRMFLDRQTDMQISCGRHEAKAIYTVDFNDDGKVVSLQAKIFLQAGRAKDVSPLVNHGVTGAFKLYDWGTLRAECKLCKTSQVSRAIMRAPGDVQGHFMAETVIEHVAAYLGVDAWKVRERNMHSVASLDEYYPGTVNSVDSYTLPNIWHKLNDQAQFSERKLAIEKFNQSSKWEKKGIDTLVCIYSTGYIQKQARVSVCEDGSVVVEVGGIEMGQGLYTKVNQAVAYGLSRLWGPDAHPSERVEMSKIRIVQNDSLSLPNSKPTGGSTGSEASCQAALLACEPLVDSLKPFLGTLRGSGSDAVPWEAIIQIANFAGASLTAHGNYVSSEVAGYLNYGACVSEVSIDVLTGSTTILQTDMLYDCGRSLNPAVDIGQIEGAFVMGVGFYLTEEFRVEDGRIITTGTWDYTPPTAENIPQQLHVELSNAKASKGRILSSKASGEPPLLLAKSVHSAVRNAIAAARDDLLQLQLPVLGTTKQNGAAASDTRPHAYFRLDSPASIDAVKNLCGLDNVERYLASLQ